MLWELKTENRVKPRYTTQYFKWIDIIDAKHQPNERYNVFECICCDMWVTRRFVCFWLDSVFHFNGLLWLLWLHAMFNSTFLNMLKQLIDFFENLKIRFWWTLNRALDLLLCYMVTPIIPSKWKRRRKSYRSLSTHIKTIIIIDIIQMETCDLMSMSLKIICIKSSDRLKIDIQRTTFSDNSKQSSISIQLQVFYKIRNSNKNE